jgi:hypothetical protein
LPEIIHGKPVFLQPLFESLQCHIQSYFISIFKTIRHGACGIGIFYLYVMDVASKIYNENIICARFCAWFVAQKGGFSMIPLAPSVQLRWPSNDID